MLGALALLEALPFTACPEAVAQPKVLAQHVPELCPLPTGKLQPFHLLFTLGWLKESQGMAVPGSGSFPRLCAWQSSPTGTRPQGLAQLIPDTPGTHKFPLDVPCLQVQRATGIGNSRNILITASDPNGFQLGASQDVRGQINFLTKDTGPPSPCGSSEPAWPGLPRVLIAPRWGG